MASPSFANIKFVTIGQGRAVHAAHVYKFHSGDERLGAKCDRTGFANAGYGRKVRPAVQYPHAAPLKVTCRSCQKIVAAQEGA